MALGRWTAPLSAIAALLCCALGAQAEQPLNWLTLADATAPAAPATPTAASQPAATSQPAADANAAAAAPAVWPPGLIMQGLAAANASKPLDDLGIRIWGFVEGGVTPRLDGGQNPLEGRVLDGKARDARLNQLRLTMDRPYDNTKNFDVGGRVDALFGGDAKFTHEAGMFDHAGTDNDDDYFDLVQTYLQMWIKTGKDAGFETTVGEFVTPIGFEALDAPLNPLYSHSFIYNFCEPYTHTGVMERYFFNAQWSAYFAVVNGWDDFHDQNHAHSYMAGGQWSSAEQLDGHARDTVNFNAICGPEQQANIHDPRTALDLIFTHWWCSPLSETVNADFVTEENAAADGGRANWGGIAHYLTYVFNDYLSGTWRIEWFRNDGDQNTNLGTNLSAYESTLGVTVTPFPHDNVLKNLSLRPEFRYDWADMGDFGADRRYQLTAALDVIFKF